ncbi:pyridoxal phosphate homeostasis protein [Venturia canescens]|uniref:pyridoxal phosphate homeostasis protein n=1 Tax=Venturia canescens TaxID=32260 RepID=UPI001C9C1DB1|nr:pyridoxal phosphate homeostasis protein [Venturia canescens]
MNLRILVPKMAEIAANLNVVRERIAIAAAKRPQELQYFQPRLVAVSKTKPPELLIAAYEAGQRNFGENYVNELIEKANNTDIFEKCKDIRWHFIGHLQRNKVNKILKVPNLYLIETIDSEKLATAVDNSWEKLRSDQDAKLNVMVQVNTSKEEEKQGCEIEETSTVVKHIIENCKNLNFMGLMTIGAYGYDLANGPNPDFITLKDCRENVCKALGLEMKNVEISMGMSSDYEHAIEVGSTNVRVGSFIFGERQKKT